MKSGLLAFQFSTERGFLAAELRYLTAGDWSHVDIRIPRNVALAHGFALLGDYGWLGARLDGGVRLRPANYANFTRTCLKDCTVPDIDAAYDFAFAQIGKPYNQRAIFDFFVHKFGKPNRFHSDQKSWFCDLLAYTVAMKGGLLLLDDPTPLNMTPQELFLSPKLKTMQAV